MLFAILQKYDFSSKSQPRLLVAQLPKGCLRYCKSTIFQANHNILGDAPERIWVVCDTAKVRFFKQITTCFNRKAFVSRCLRYCKSTIFQANHNFAGENEELNKLFAILQKYDFSSKSQRQVGLGYACQRCLRYCKSTIFQANHNYSSVWY